MAVLRPRTYFKRVWEKKESKREVKLLHLKSQSNGAGLHVRLRLRPLRREEIRTHPRTSFKDVSSHRFRVCVSPED